MQKVMLYVMNLSTNAITNVSTLVHEISDLTMCGNASKSRP